MGLRGVLAVSKDHVGANRVGRRIHPSRRFHGPRIRVHTHIAEIMTKARFHECARLAIKRLSR
jgi:hypothetical protein